MGKEHYQCQLDAAAFSMQLAKARLEKSKPLKVIFDSMFISLREVVEM